jgi:hypothetical protein
MAAVCKTIEPAHTKDERERERERERRDRERQRQKKKRGERKGRKDKGQNFIGQTNKGQRPYPSNQSLALFASQA